MLDKTTPHPLPILHAPQYKQNLIMAMTITEYKVRSVSPSTLLLAYVRYRCEVGNTVQFLDQGGNPRIGQITDKRTISVTVRWLVAVVVISHASVIYHQLLNPDGSIGMGRTTSVSYDISWNDGSGMPQLTTLRHKYVTLYRGLEDPGWRSR